MYAIQLDFFKTEEQCELDALRLQVAALKQSLDKVRKGTYARLNEHGKDLIELKDDMALLKRYICHEK